MRTEITEAGAVPVLVLAGLLLVTATALAGRRWAAVLVFPFAVAWILFNGPLEGPVLLTLTREHGVTVSDLLSLVALGVALVALARPARPPARGGAP